MSVLDVNLSGFYTVIQYYENKRTDDLDGAELTQANLPTAHAHPSTEPPLGPD